MSASAPFLNPAEAARRIGISAKALRLYERHGLIRPVRTAAGWRSYGPAEMARAGVIATLRRLGLGFAQIGRVLGGNGKNMEPALAAHEAALDGRLRALAKTIAEVRSLRADLAENKPTVFTGPTRSVAGAPPSDVVAAFDLPWPWGGERFELSAPRPLTYLIGPLGSGKTRLAQAIAAHLPGAAFVGLDRLADDAAAARARLQADPALVSRVEQSLARLAGAGATRSPALIALIVALETEGPAALVVDMVEQGLDGPTQAALAWSLRRRGTGARPLFLMTRSSAILDLAAIGPDEAIILCPANHSPPLCVTPYPGAPGYEAVATCLASPAVRARTDGVIAMRPQMAETAG